MLKKFRAAVFAAAVLWLIVLVQIIVTRVYVSQTAFTQAFATNHVTVSKEETERHNDDARNGRKGNLCTQGEVQGRLSQDEMKELARRIFRTGLPLSLPDQGSPLFPRHPPPDLPQPLSLLPPSFSGSGYGP